LNGRAASCVTWTESHLAAILLSYRVEALGLSSVRAFDRWYRPSCSAWIWEVELRPWVVKF
jgi:hypothetical protein